MELSSFFCEILSACMVPHIFPDCVIAFITWDKIFEWRLSVLNVIIMLIHLNIYNDNIVTVSFVITFLNDNINRYNSLFVVSIRL